MTPEITLQLATSRIAELHREREADRLARLASQARVAPLRRPLVRSILRRIVGPAVA